MRGKNVKTCSHRFNELKKMNKHYNLDHKQQSRVDDDAHFDCRSIEICRSS